MKTKQAIDFLRQFHPTGWWVLTSIEPNKTRIETISFDARKEQSGAEHWINHWDGQRNIYFSVAQPLRELKKKADKRDIAYTRYLHVDVDARVGENLKDEQKRIHALLTDNRPKNIPEPTFLVFSGGGYQAFWRLTTEVTINGDLSLAEDFERYNKMIEITLSADRCHNIDRIMRLPGTTNLPDEKKLSRGRVPTRAKLLSSDGPTIDLGDMLQSPPVQSGAGWEGATPKLRISTGDVERVKDLSELKKWDVSERIRIMIGQGEDPDSDRHVSRSERVFEVVCTLVRCNVPIAMIFSLITDPQYGISEHVLEQKNVQRYALRQIERAQDEVEEPLLRELNERFAVIQNMGGKCRVIEEEKDSTVNRARLTKMSFVDFRNAWLNKKIQVGEDSKGRPKLKQAGQWWLEHPRRRQYDRLVFSPGKEIEGAYNLWQGFRFEPRAGNCELFLNHIHDNICAGNTTSYEYLIRWMARCVQHPDRPGLIAVVLRGKQGTGKSFFATNFGEIFGRHFLQIADAKHLVGAFNAHLRDCVVLFSDEAFYAGDKKHESVLKTLVTERQLHYEAKGVDSEQGPNFTHLIMASNSDWVVPADMDDRRFFVLDVGQQRMQDRSYFREIKKQLDEGGYEALLHRLMNVKLDGWDVGDVPKTLALREQQLLSMDPIEEWWYTKLRDGRLVKNDSEWRLTIPCVHLIEDYLMHHRDYNISRRASETALGIFLRKVVPGDDMPMRKLRTAKVEIVTKEGLMLPQSKRMYHYEMPCLQDCRVHWEGLFNTADPWQWPNETPTDEVF